MDVLSCMAQAKELPVRMLAIYSHLLSATIAVFLGFYAFRATKRSKLSIIFLFFTLAVAVWLLGDVLLWTFPGYNLVAFIWSWVDFVDVVFFILAAYFFITLARGAVPNAQKLLLLALSVPSFFFTATGNAITAFDHSWCELWNNDNAVLYKQIAEWTAIFLMLHAFVVSRKLADNSRRKALLFVFIALLLFLAAFSVTEYLAARTAIYEINLYGLFILPVFLIAMVFAITNLEVFKIRYLGTQILIYVLIILVASQFLFLQSSTDAALNLVTLGIAFVIGVILLRNEKRGLMYLLEIEQLNKRLSAANIRLKELDQLKSQFLSFASHQLKTPLAAIKWQSELLAEGSMGVLPEKAVGSVRGIGSSANDLVNLVSDFLDLRRIEEGRMEYKLEVTDAMPIIRKSVEQIRPLAERKGLELTIELPDEPYELRLDAGKFEQAVRNLVDNAVKYTDSGTIRVHVDCDEHALRFTVADSGRGMDASVIPHVFEQFVRAQGVEKPIAGTGLGLYIAQHIIEAHRGRIEARSDGLGKGSTFSFVIPR